MSHQAVLRFVIGINSETDFKVFYGDLDVTPLFDVKRLSFDLDTDAPDWPHRTRLSLEALAEVEVEGETELLIQARKELIDGESSGGTEEEGHEAEALERAEGTERIPSNPFD